MSKRADILIIAGLLLLIEMASAFYDANLGRWLNRDPLEETGSLNLYAFSDNAPIAKLDPFGLTSIIVGPPEIQNSCKCQVTCFFAGMTFGAGFAGVNKLTYTCTDGCTGAIFEKTKWQPYAGGWAKPMPMVWWYFYTLTPCCKNKFS